MCKCVEIWLEVMCLRDICLGFFLPFIDFKTTFIVDFINKR